MERAQIWPAHTTICCTRRMIRHVGDAGTLPADTAEFTGRSDE